MVGRRLRDRSSHEKPSTGSVRATNITMRAANGTIIDVSEWTDEAAIARAHETPEVLELWKRFDECSSYAKLETLEEIRHDFATFEAEQL